MHELAREDWARLRDWLEPERPCELIGRHTLATGCGAWWVDRWPEARCAVAFAGGNLTLLGDAAALEPSALVALVEVLLDDWDHVFFDVGDAFVPAVRAALTDHSRWPRVKYTTERPLPTSLDVARFDAGAIRRLGAGDAEAVGALGDDIAWISDTLDGPAALAQRATAFGAFADGRLVSVAVPFYVGESFEELGVVTEADHRGAGWSTACATAVIADVQARGRIPCWSTTPDNTASRRVAEKLGFVYTGDVMHYMAGEPITGALPPV